LPPNLLQLQSLYYISISNNPRMRSQTLPDFRLSSTTSRSYDKFTCIKLEYAQGSFDYDDSYYNYTLCACDPGYAAATATSTSSNRSLMIAIA